MTMGLRLQLVDQRRLGALLVTIVLGTATPAVACANADHSYRPIANDCSAGHVAFTFDDGPDVNTPAVLKTLRKLNLKAVFFVIGKKLKNNPDNVATLAAEVAGRFPVENHTFDHASLTGVATGKTPLTDSQILDELDATNAAVTAAGAPKPTLYRPPYGDINAWADNVAEHDGLRLVMPFGLPGANIIDSQDWAGMSPAQIAHNVTNGYTIHGAFYPGIKNESIVSMHDGGNDSTLNTIAALQPIVDYMNDHHLCSTSKIRADATGGFVPVHAPEPPPSGNLVENPSLEQLQGSGPAAEPTCFEHSDSNAAGNVATWSITSDAHSGNDAERVDVTNWSAGDSKLITSEDAPSCLASVTPGTSYATWVWYKGSWADSGASPTRASIVTFYRSSSGTWTYWTESASYPPSQMWNLAYFVTPPLPAGATAISYGMAITGNGTLITDDYSMAGVATS